MTNGNEKPSTVNSAGMSYLPEKNFPAWKTRFFETIIKTLEHSRLGENRFSYGDNHAAEEALQACGRAFMGVRYGLFRMTGKAFSRHRGDRKRVKKVFYSWKIRKKRNRNSAKTRLRHTATRSGQTILRHAVLYSALLRCQNFLLPERWRLTPDVSRIWAPWHRRWCLPHAQWSPDARLL